MNRTEKKQQRSYLPEQSTHTLIYELSRNGIQLLNVVGTHSVYFIGVQHSYRLYTIDLYYVTLGKSYLGLSNQINVLDHMQIMCVCSTHIMVQENLAQIIYQRIFSILVTYTPLSIGEKVCSPFVFKVCSLEVLYGSYRSKIWYINDLGQGYTNGTHHVAATLQPPNISSNQNDQNLYVIFRRECLTRLLDTWDEN